MEQFNLDEYRRNPECKIMTRDGHSVRIICTDRISTKPICALVTYKDNDEVREDIVSYYRNGTTGTSASFLDLFFVPTKRTGYINLYKISGKLSPSSTIFLTKERALECAAETCIDTIEITWEE